MPDDNCARIKNSDRLETDSRMQSLCISEVTQEAHGALITCSGIVRSLLRFLTFSTGKSKVFFNGDTNKTHVQRNKVPFYFLTYLVIQRNYYLNKVLLLEVKFCQWNGKVKN